MDVVRHDVPEPLGLARGTAAICVPVYGARDLLRSCLRTIFLHTPADVPVLIADDHSPGPDDIIDVVRAALAEVAGARRHVHYFRQPVNVGFVENVNTAFAMLAAADVLIVNSDVEVADGWFDRMRAAAATDTRVATVSTLTNHGSIASVPERNAPTSRLPEGIAVAEAARPVADASLLPRQKVPVAMRHSVLFTTSALRLLWESAPACAPG